MESRNLNEFRVHKLPCTAYYIPNFISEIEEEKLLEKVYSAPKPKWKQLLNRRLQNWGGLPHPKGMIQEPLPEWISTCMEKITLLGVFGEKRPNHALVNEYHSGQGIMPHEDGPLFYPTITTINLGSHTSLNYYEKIDNDEPVDKELKRVENRHISSILLERCSLLIVQDDLYHKYLHGIEEKTNDIVDDKIANISLCKFPLGAELQRETRISITIRHVPHTVKSSFLFLRT